MDISKLDPESRTQLKIIELETAVEKLNKALGEFQSAHTGLERLGELENRVKELEGARLAQKLINAKLLNPEEKSKAIINPWYNRLWPK